MNSWRPVGWLLPAIASFCVVMQSAAAESARDEIRLVGKQGTVEISTDGGTSWARSETNRTLQAGHHLRTGAHSRATLRVSASTYIPFGELTEIEILAPDTPGIQPGIHIIKGILSYFHRDEPGRTRVIAPGAVAGVDGTEFVVMVDSVNGLERTTLAVIDGKVWIEHAQGRITLTNGEQAIVELGGRPVRVTGFIVNNVLQWAFYYPAVLNADDLALDANEEAELKESLQAYRSGDLLAALAALGTKEPASEKGRLYKAALLLSAGSSQQAEDALVQLENGNVQPRIRRLASALRQQIAVVKGQVPTEAMTRELPTELLAASYYEQSRRLGDDSLSRALVLAKQAATNSPQFGFAWARVAELEFSFGRTDRANEALARSLAVSPRNAQALAVQGFLFAARNKTDEAIDSFERALEIDASLANAWLGRGLCRIRMGDAAAGREDLLVAAALEPRRAQLRSYLGKSFGDAGDSKRALHELELAKEIDAADPTSWFYSALLKAEHNQINDAINDLQKSQELNDNRRVFRSSLLLDRDRASRSANLAPIYRDVGMIDWSVYEAARAVSFDYENYSAHHFLASSYDELRDPRRVNLRYETPAESEYLIANLLAPASGGILSQPISQGEYTRLFERNRLGVFSRTEYLSSGDWLQSGAQFGTLGNMSYSLEAAYRTVNGQRPNNDFEERVLSAKVKQELTPQDSLFFQATHYEATGGDVAQYYSQASANPRLRTQENQEPILSLGYQHEWRPGVQTLFLASRLSDRLSVRNPTQPSFFVRRDDKGLQLVEPIKVKQRYHSTLEIYSAELQQIVQQKPLTSIVGVRWQGGEFDTKNLQTQPIQTDRIEFFDPDNPAAKQNLETGFDRFTAYAYEHLSVCDDLLLVGGIAYDRVRFPKNFRGAPISDEKETIDRLVPKAGLVWTPTRLTTVRAAYTRSLGGASIDQSLRLEPSQVAGFNQSFRSIIPESIIGATAGAHFETYDISLEQRFPTKTYFGLGGEILASKVNRTLGEFEANFDGFATLGQTREKDTYEEQSIFVTLNQLVGEEWSFGARYRLADADAESRFPEVVKGARLEKGFQRRSRFEATLHQILLQANYNHSSGIFATAQALWYGQDNGADASALRGDEFWQFNVFGGYRFWRRRVEATVGVLNITDQDYRLNPLTYYNELPRERTFVARLQLVF